ncbi:MAG: response regulator transcription factor [Acidobacteriota bacterium]|jgi:DNA-binding NarL/FixJ family response regulator|nr:response regulator transcription factor [Acidobacteriota bacterium]
MKTDIRVLIADDHPIVRQGLRQVIEADPQLKVVAEAGDGQTALERIQTLQPEIAVLDIDMPEMDGFAIARALREQELNTAVIFLTIHREEDFFNEALDVGPKATFSKTAPPPTSWPPSAPSPGASITPARH